MATAMPPRRVDFDRIVNTAADNFEQSKRIKVSPDGRQALVDPAIPYQDRVENELRSGEITYQFLTQSVTEVLENGLDIIRIEDLPPVINGNVVRKSMKRYCPYIMWC